MRRIGGWWDEGGRKRTTETLSLYAEGEASRGGWCGGVKTVTSLASRRYRFLETMPQAPFMHASVHVCVCVCIHMHVRSAFSWRCFAWLCSFPSRGNQL